SNAIKFTDRGEVVVRVEAVNAQRQAIGNEPPVDGPSPAPDSPTTTTMLQFTVSDTGIGIPPEKRAAIFQPFEQADTSARRRYEGTGLGLAIASQLCALMGGRIWVESKLGQGSTFHFTAQFELGQAKESISAVSLREMPVLIVDDNTTTRQQLVDWLRQWNA